MPCGTIPYDRGKPYPVHELCDTLYALFVDNDACVYEPVPKEVDALRSCAETLCDLLDTLIESRAMEADGDNYGQDGIILSSLDVEDDYIQAMTDAQDALRDAAEYMSFGMEQYCFFDELFFRVRSDANNAIWWLCSDEGNVMEDALELQTKICDFLSLFERTMQPSSDALKNTLTKEHDSSRIIRHHHMDEMEHNLDLMLDDVHEMELASNTVLRAMDALEQCQIMAHRDPYVGIHD